MFRNWIKPAALIGLLWAGLSVAMAGTFTPAAGTTISSSTITIAWQSDGQEQWIRGFDSNGNKLFDSDRQMSSEGSKSFSIDSELTQLEVIFFEKIEGRWSSESRLYTVNIGDSGGSDMGGDSSGVTLAELENLLCRNGEEIFRGLGGVIQCGVSCPYADELTTLGLTVEATDPQGNGFFVSDDEPGRCVAQNDGTLSFARLVETTADWELTVSSVLVSDSDFSAELDFDETKACAILMDCRDLLNPF